MLRSILVGLDGSEYSDAAVELGLRWARKCNCLLAGLGVVDEPDIFERSAVPIGASHFKEHADRIQLARETQRIETYLDGFANHCKESAVRHKIIEDIGFPEKQILLEAQRYDLLLLGTQTFFRFGSRVRAERTLEHVLRNTPRPVVTVPKQLLDGSSILIAYDGSLQAARALSAYQMAGPDLGLPVHVLCVAPGREAAETNAGRVLEFLAHHGVAANPIAVASRANPADILLQHERDLQPALVVMGAYGGQTLLEFFIGSVTAKLLRQTQVPLFLYH